MEKLLLVGHGKGSSPEIHSRGPGFMLSAGGYQRGEVSQIVARPIVLMLNDGATDLMQCFHINGKGDWTKWNNTGVSHRFAVGLSPVHVPEQYSVSDSVGNWKRYDASGLTIITYSLKDFGLIYLPTEDVDLNQLATSNPEPEKGVFNSKGTTLRYDTHASRGKWVMISSNGLKLERRTDSWKRLNSLNQ
jgi:hypothetical protein